MKKAKFIYGPPASGKTFLANLFAEFYEHPVILCRRDTRAVLKGNFSPQSITHQTDLIVLEEWAGGLNYELVDIIRNGLMVNQKHQSIYNISPAVIIVSQNAPDTSILKNRDFEFIETGVKSVQETQTFG